MHAAGDSPHAEYVTIIAAVYDPHIFAHGQLQIWKHQTAIQSASWLNLFLGSAALESYPLE